MRLFDRLEARFDDWKSKRSAKRSLEQLVDQIADANRLLEAREGIYAAMARYHLECAESAYRQGVTQFKEEEFDDCLEYIERSELHLRLSQLHLGSYEETKFDPGFADGSAEQLVAHLSESIARTKLAVEYSNCFVSERVKKGLITVVSLFHDAIDRLRNRHWQSARRTADGGVLLLYMLTLQMEIDNQQQIVDIKLLTKAGNKLDKKIKELADRMTDCKRLFADAGMPVPARAQTHFDEAESNLTMSVQSVIDDDIAAVDVAVSAGMMELKLAEKLFKASGKVEPEPKAQRNARDDHEEGDDRFQDTAFRLQQLLDRIEVRQPESVEKHLKAAVKYYAGANAALRDGAAAEAERLARAAYLDLDYARQLVFSKEKPRYRDI